MSRPGAWPLLAVLALCALLAACGSAVDPATYRAANGLPLGPADAAAGAGPGAVPTSWSASGSAGSAGGSGAGGLTGTGGAPAGAAAPGGAAGAAGGSPAGGNAPGGGAAGPSGTGVNAATGTTSKASCAGIRNQTGITDKTITIANASDISGPVPGIFQSAQDATKAYVAYFNATSDICGRKLQLENLDTHTDAGGDQEAYANACESAFAAVGSMSAFDSGGAATAQGCGLPDLRSTTVNPERSRCTTCFAAQAVTVNLVGNAVPQYFKQKYPAAASKAAFLYINAGAAPVNAQSFIKAWEANGFDVVYDQPIDVSEFNYAPFVEQMKSKGVRYVQYLGPYQDAVRLAQAMQQQGFKPDVFALDPTGYDQRFVETGGSAVEGTRVFLNITPFEETSSSKEMQLYRAWLQQVNPNAVPDFYGVFAWSAARLFVQEATALGGRLTRAALVAKLRTVDNWTGNGIHSPQHVGSKRTGECWRVIRLQGGRWVPESGRSYMCKGLADTHVGE